MEHSRRIYFVRLRPSEQHTAEGNANFIQLIVLLQQRNQYASLRTLRESFLPD